MFNDYFSLKKIMLLILCSTAAASISCSEKPSVSSFKGKVTFITGSAQVQTPDGKTIQLNAADTVEGDSIISTGAKSFLFIQFGELSVVKIQENSSIKIAKISSEKDVELLLEQGQVLSKINKLSKNESFNIKTPTVVASVRGTQFSVKYNEGQTNVTVSQGKVSVGIKKSGTDKPAESLNADDYVELKEVEAGKTAFIEKTVTTEAAPKKGDELIVITEINEAEKSSFKDIDSVPIISKPEDKKAEEIKEIYKPVREIIETSANEKPGVKTPLTKAEKAEKIKQLIQKKTATEAEIKETFDRIDEITLFNKNIIRGAIISRGETYTVLTSKGTIKVKQDDINNIKVIK